MVRGTAVEAGTVTPNPSEQPPGQRGHRSEQNQPDQRERQPAGTRGPGVAGKEHEFRLTQPDAIAMPEYRFVHALVVHERAVGGQRVHDHVMALLVHDPGVRGGHAGIADHDVVVATPAYRLPAGAHRKASAAEFATDAFEYRLVDAGAPGGNGSRLACLQTQCFGGKQSRALRAGRSWWHRFAVVHGASESWQAREYSQSSCRYCRYCCKSHGGK